jgi:hypothetical protein
MDKYDCTCGGLNGNCFRCFGTGLVESSAPIVGRPHKTVVPHPDSPATGKRARKRKVKSASLLTAATQDGAGFPPDDVGHGGAKLDIPLCPICKKQMLTMEGLRSHIVSGHGRKLPGATSRRSNTGLSTTRRIAPNGQNEPISTAKPYLGKSKRKTEASKKRVQPKVASKDNVDALDHPSRYPGSFGSGKRR